MIKCNAAGRHCFVMKTVLEHPIKGNKKGVVLTEDKAIVYRIKLSWLPPVDYVMPYCPWCGARLRGAVRRAKEET